MTKEINNYYETQTEDYNWMPIKLNSFNKENNVFNDKTLNIKDGNFSEISINQVHLDRMNFSNNNKDGVFVNPMYFILSKELLNLTLIYFGYLVFHKEEINEAQRNTMKFIID